jgi:hypothetical protein
VPHATLSVFWRRRLAALALLAALAAVIWLVACGTGGREERSAGSPAAGRAAAAPPQLPRGGREVLPRYRVVAYYGAPQSAELGTLGIGRPDAMVARLERQARPYVRRSRPVMPALELISVVAAADAGEDGRYNLRQDDAVIRRYLRAARRAKALLLLDIQPGHADFFTETTRLRKWLRQPDVGLALDPEWRVGPGQVPGKVIGHVDSREINATTAWLAQLVAKENLPQKLVVVHQFTDDMVDETALKARRGLAMVLNADGFGSAPVKISKYHRFTRQSPGFGSGFKLFYKEDLGLMSPRHVLRLRPAPDFVVYE